MRNDRILVLLAVIGLIAVSSIGVAYAYTAFTTNEDNSIDVEYLIVKPSDGTDAVYSGTFTEDVAFDTQTVLTDKGELADPRYVQEVVYSLADGTFDTISGHEYVPLGTIYLTVDETRSDDDYRISVTVDDGEGLNVTDFRYYAFFKVGSADSYEDALDEAEDDEGQLVQLSLSSGDYVAQSSVVTNSASNTHTVALITIYLSMPGDSVTKPLNTPLSVEVLDDVTFIFKAATV